MRGQFKLWGWNIKTGRRELLVDQPNLILDAMATQLTKLLASGTATQSINRMQFGSGNVTPSASDTHLQVPVTPIKSVTPTVTIGTYSVQYVAYLQPLEANGFPIAEAGLVCADNVLVARTVFAAQVKTASYQWGISWTVQTKA